MSGYEHEHEHGHWRRTDRATTLRARADALDERLVVSANFHESHQCKDCGAVITIPYALSDKALHPDEPWEFELWDGSRLVVGIGDSDPGDIGEPRHVSMDGVGYLSVRAAIRAESGGLDVERLADDVRYAGGNGTSDYWRGFNDGIDKLVARLAEDADAS